MKSVWRIIKSNTNVRYYLIFSFTQSLWFIESVWYFYWAKFLTYSQVGLVFSFLVVVGMIAEIPTGYFADKFGRKNSVISGTLFLSVGSVLMTTATNSLMLVAGVTLMSIGRAFVSGALEALTYDSLEPNNAAVVWDKLASLKMQVSMTAYLLAVPIGGFLYQNNFRLPNMLEMLAMIFSIFIACRLTEKKVNKTNNSGVEIGIKGKELLIGFKELMTISLRPYILMAFLIITVFELYDWGLSKPAMAVNFGLDSKGQAIVYSIIAIVNILAVGQMPKLRKWWGDYWGLRILNIINGVVFIGSTLVWGYWGIPLMMIIEAVGNMGDPWTSSIINERMTPAFRATTLSTLAFMTRIPHFFVNILAGEAIEKVNINMFHFGLGLAIIMMVVTSFIPWKSSKLTQITK